MVRLAVQPVVGAALIGLDALGLLADVAAAAEPRLRADGAQLGCERNRDARRIVVVATNRLSWRDSLWCRPFLRGDTDPNGGDLAMTSSDIGLFILRLVVGLTMAAHGAQKAFGWWKGSGWSGWRDVMVRMGFRPPALWGAVGIVAELVGGLLLAIGFLTPLAAMALIGQSVVIIIKAHWSRGFWGRDGGYEFPLSLAAGVVAIVGTGAGALSVDALLGLSWSVEVRLALAALGIVGGLAGIAVNRMFAAPKPAEPTS